MTFPAEGGACQPRVDLLQTRSLPRVLRRTVRLFVNTRRVRELGSPVAIAFPSLYSHMDLSAATLLF